MADATVDQALRRQARQRADHPAVIDPADRVTFGELELSTRTVAAGLLQAGVNRGARVGLLMPNGVDWVRLAFAVTRIGAVLVPLSTLLAPPELLAQLRRASVGHLISVDSFRGHRYRQTVDEHRADLPALHRVWTAAEALALPRRAVDDDIVDELTSGVRAGTDLAIMFTSGSRGAPKGVLHSHGNALRAVRSGLAARCVTAESRLYLPMPLFWVGGFGAGALTALVSGATLVTEPVPTPESTLRLLERERVTLFRGWPSQAEALASRLDSVRADLSALRPGSLDALLPEHLRSAQGARANLFGMTESFGPYCGYPADTDMPRSAWGSCGKPFPGMDVRIVDPDTGAPAPTGRVGEIQIRGPHVLRGLLARPRPAVFTADEYYPTGDLGRFDADGYLFFQGRSDDMFKVSGATVYPGEVEDALRSIAGVRAVAVTDVPGPRGPQVGAMVACDDTIEDLRAAARNLLSSFKVPTVWIRTDDETDIPRGPTGKIDVAALRARLAGR
ncbi:AMP-binding protein [Mycolicibacterium duvalii]|uniref:AMP-binding protein n=1 Tax=Mycolicibacterium duvalii TaxID=39688 RepID=A0A7I7K2E1_9MYCO|nr:class I adenylate-forming enzyme family protein [Mycolicibacterium duvalii]MCV7370496.1 acyl--CoA ligase [Mycolicibacterium duvalii]PEG37418.1 AMP-binding protein [Mycolicibacterium duvalii]BBX17659.1 AMP-binding protein [Mycolicibacterium duvalii]